jgi:drug/metabolite transporter (DMT)-like permease
MVAVTILGEPVGSTILAYFILGEGLTTWKVLGGMLILAGILIALGRQGVNPISGSLPSSKKNDA